MAVIAGVIGNSIAVNIAAIDSGSVICVDFSRHGVFMLFVFGDIVNVIV